jgi:hypothetical protein
MNMNTELSVIAGEDLEPGRVVGFDGTYADSETVSPAGITAAFSETGDVATLVNEGIYLCDSTGAIAQGTPVAAGTDGKMVDASAIPGDGVWILGVAVKAASGGKVQVLYRPAYIPAL